MRNKRKSYGVNIGSSSILLIFVILCLVSFAVLSIVSAQTDYKLSCKLAERTTKYYEANNEVESYLRDLQASLEKIYEDSATAEEYFAVAGHDTTFSIQLSEQQMLNVHLTISIRATEKDITRLTPGRWRRRIHSSLMIPCRYSRICRFDKIGRKPLHHAGAFLCQKAGAD